MLTILTICYLNAKVCAVRLHKLLGSHPLLALPCWTLGSTSIHLTRPVWTTAILGRLSASLNLVCAVRLPSLKFTCRRRRWRSTKEENTDKLIANASRLAARRMLGFAGRYMNSSLVERQLVLSPTTAATHALVSLGRTLR